MISQIRFCDIKNADFIVKRRLISSHMWLHCQVCVESDRNSHVDAQYHSIFHRIDVLKKTCCVLEHEQCIQLVPTKATILYMEVGLFYLEIFPYKMSVYVRLQCINPSTIRREISNNQRLIVSVSEDRPTYLLL